MAVRLPGRGADGKDRLPAMQMRQGLIGEVQDGLAAAREDLRYTTRTVLP